MNDKTKVETKEQVFKKIYDQVSHIMDELIARNTILDFVRDDLEHRTEVPYSGAIAEILRDAIAKIGECIDAADALSIEIRHEIKTESIFNIPGISDYDRTSIFNIPGTNGGKNNARN